MEGIPSSGGVAGHKAWFAFSRFVEMFIFTDALSDIRRRQIIITKVTIEFWITAIAHLSQSVDNCRQLVGQHTKPSVINQGLRCPVVQTVVVGWQTKHCSSCRWADVFPGILKTNKLAYIRIYVYIYGGKKKYLVYQNYGRNDIVTCSLLCHVGRIYTYFIIRRTFNVMKASNMFVCIFLCTWMVECLHHYLIKLTRTKRSS